MLRNKEDLSMLPIKVMIYVHLSQTSISIYECSEYDQVFGNKVLLSILV